MNEQQVSESILALASAVAGEDLTGEGDGTKATALSVLGSVVGEIDSDTALYNAAQFATRRSTDTKDAAESVLALSQGGGSSKELLFEETVTATTFPAGGIANLSYNKLIDVDVAYVTFDGVEYTCRAEKSEDSGITSYRYGASGLIPDFSGSEYPFQILSTTSGEGSNQIITATAGTHTVKVEVEGSGGGTEMGTLTLPPVHSAAGTFTVDGTAVEFVEEQIGELTFRVASIPAGSIVAFTPSGIVSSGGVSYWTREQLEADGESEFSDLIVSPSATKPIGIPIASGLITNFYARN